MSVVPTYESDKPLQPTEWNPKFAAVKGEELEDIGGALKGVSDQMKEHDNWRQTLKAKTALANAHNETSQMIATDPNIDTLKERVDQRNAEAISQSADMIQDPTARQKFTLEADYETARQNITFQNTINRRKIRDGKDQYIRHIDTLLDQREKMINPKERQYMTDQAMQASREAVDKGYVNEEWTHQHVTDVLKDADIKQVTSDMAIDPTHTYEQLQKGKDGLYSYLNEGQRKAFMDKAQKMIAKEGSDRKLIYGIAQNEAEDKILDKASDGSLTQDYINHMATVGDKGIRPRQEFIKAATEAMQDPFPTESVPDKYNKLVDQIQDVSEPIDPIKLKLDVLNARGLTVAQKAHLINAHLREDPEEGKESISQMIGAGIKQNKEKLMEANKALQAEIQQRQGLLRNITDRYRDHAKNQDHLAQLQQKFMEASQDVKDDSERMQIAQEILNKDTLKRNPGIATSNEKGTIFMDKTTGAKRRYFPNGYWQPVKANEQ